MVSGQTLQIDPPSKSFASEDFDEGLDDEDLLAIQVFHIVPELQFDSRQIDTMLNSDDDYPIDEADEQELLQFAMIKTAANDKKDIEPPSSIQHAFDDEQEVFNSSLQFSPPKHQDSANGPTNKTN